MLFFVFRAYGPAASMAKVAFVLMVALGLSGVSVVVNPYADVDWETVGRHRANLHTHTTQSDGLLPPHEVVDEYRARGYSILALTDHNLCTWPWDGLASMERKGRAAMSDGGDEAADDDDDDDEAESGSRRRLRRPPPVPAYEDRDAAALGMLAVAGNEPSRHHHMGAYFIEYETNSRVLEETLAEVREAGGVAMLFHPGRYWKPAEDGSIPDEVIQQYVTLYRENDHLFGMEVINQGMRYKNDVALWDKVLTEMMPERPVWGYANDDMHAPGTLGRDSSVFLLTTLDETNLREAMLAGRSYVSSVSTHDREVRSFDETPVITSIVHDEAAGTITINATSGGQPLPDEAVIWISKGVVVHTGPVLAYREVDGLGSYVRAELRGKGGSAFTNPFGLAD